MGFETLLGNDRLKANLAEAIAKKHIAHFYLISGPEGSGKRTLAKLMAAAILCQGTKKPCFSCGPCRKVMEGNHPDFITVEDREHKNVAVKLVREIRDDMFIRPNESDYKIYLFPQELGIEGQNALLKVLEEPKMQAIPEPELRRQLRLDFPNAQEEDLSAAVMRSGGFLGQARALLKEGDQLPPQTEGFVKAFAERNALLLTQTLAPMEKWKREALSEILRSWLELMESALACRSGIQAVSAQARTLSTSRSSAELAAGVRCLKKALDYTLSNVSPAAVCGWLAWALR